MIGPPEEGLQVPWLAGKRVKGNRHWGRRHISPRQLRVVAQHSFCRLGRAWDEGPGTPRGAERRGQAPGELSENLGQRQPRCPMAQTYPP